MTQLSIAEAARIEQLTFAEAGPECDRRLSQWFTPPSIAGVMAQMADVHLRSRPDFRVLEPSAGCGHLVRAVLDRAEPGCTVDAVELDPRWRPDLERTGANVHIGCYLERPAPEKLYHLAITNPPFDGGLEGPHLEKMMRESLRIIALLPARSLHGADRHSRIWSRMGRGAPGEGWWLRGVTYLVLRPKFGGSGGSDEIVIVDLQRVPGQCHVRWV